MSLPRSGAPEWAPAQATPWTTVNKGLRILDAFASRAVIEDRDLTAPPVSCDDGDGYLIAAGASGEWYGHDGDLAIAVGANAANGWHFAEFSLAGNEAYVKDEAAYIQYDGAAWVLRPDGISSLADLDDVTLAGVMDGYSLFYDASSGLFYAAAPTSETATPITTLDTAAHILDPATAGHYHRFTYDGAKTYTIEPDSTTPLINGSEWHGRNAGTGDLTLTEGSGVTITPPAGGTLVIPTNGTFTLKRIATNLFDLFGATT